MKIKLAIAAFLLLCAVSVKEVQTREITHEDIKEAMLSLVHMMRENTDKLERHELRDRQTAEQMRKALTLLTKRMSTIDGLKTYLVKLDERLDGIEQQISQKDERQRVQIQKTADTLEDMESRLEGWATEIESKVGESTNRLAAEVIARIGVAEQNGSSKLEGLSQTLGKAAQEARDSVLQEVKGVSDGLQEARGALAKLGDRETPAASEHSSLALVEQTMAITRVQSLLESTLEQLKQLPRVSELETMHNETQMSLQEARHVLGEAISQGNEGIEGKVAETKDETRDLITSLRSELSNNAGRINEELRDLGKGQSVMVEMADHVMDTKKRLEHAYKILREVGELVMAQGLNINHTLNSRFDGISNDIMDNQNGALANLTTKMEQEMNQVWRQINVMYQQMTVSADALDKLHKQNEAYVNGTTSTMDGMESKVGEITKRMSEVDTNLNYLLGRLSLVTQEFNQIKQGLGAALDNIKASFKEVQERANDLSGNPGPHALPDNYKELENPDSRDPLVYLPETN